MKRENNRYIFTDDGIFDKVLMKMYPRYSKYKCKYCKHLLVNLDSSTIQTCWLSHNFVDVEDVCDEFEFSKKRYDGYNKWLMMSEECRKCLRPFYSAYYGCADIDLFDCCTTSKEKHDSCKFYMNKDE